MPLQPGTTLGPYSVTAKIGEGGMGEVYRARDTKLDRDVALKVLPQAFTDDPDRLARFEREAKVLASLNHPNIGHIYGLEEAEGTRALVLELIDGPTLADRIAQGPIPIDEALPIAKQIAEALEAAHEAGVIHRDLKPANVKVKSDGTVKVLDFGLAKALDTTPQGDPSLSPTLTAAATQMGVIMGTAAYMSPEQARGKPVDKRADIWAFGVVLYEMLTGQRAFKGEDVSVTLADVIRAEVSWERLPRALSPGLATFLRRCLEKDPRQRVRDIGDFRLVMDGGFEIPATNASAANRPRIGWTPILLAAALVFLVGGLAGVFVSRSLTDSERPARVTRRFSIPPLASGQWLPQVPSFAALSPDGSDLAYTADFRLHHHSLESGRWEVLPTLGFVAAPFFSPNGEWVAYWDDRGLQRVRLAGGASQAVCACALSPGSAGAWGPDGTIVFSSPSFSTVLSQVPVAGGEPQAVTTLREGERRHEFPQFLPDGNGIVFTIVYQDASRPNHIAIRLFDETEPRMVVEGTRAHLTSTGHLVYGGARGDTLWAAPFDLNTLETTGEAVLMAEGLRSTRSTPFFALGADGTLAYLDRDVTEASQLVWVDRQGQEEPLQAERRPYFLPKVSPDGQRVAVEIRESDNTDIWVYDNAAANLGPVAVGSEDEVYPLWTTDGRSVIYTSSHDDGSGLFLRSSYGTGDAELLSPSEFHRHALGWSGSTLVLGEVGPVDGLVSLEPGDNPSELMFTEDSPYRAAVSADGEWVAYVSQLSGVAEVYVRSLVNPDGRRVPVSPGGGVSPVWSPGSSELFYRNGDAMIAATFDAETFSIVERETLFEGSYLTANGRMYDVSPDGQRFLMVKPEAGAESVSSGDDLHLVVDWFEELKERVPIP